MSHANPAGPWPGRADLLAMVRLAVPVTTVQLGVMAMGVVDTMVVGRISAEALAAVALGNLYFFATCAFGMGTLLALDPLVAQAVGGGDRAAVRGSVQRGLLLALALSVPAMALQLPGEAVLRALRQPPEVVPVAARYARACAPSVLPFFVFVVLRQTLQAMRRVRPVVAVIVAANLLNLVLDLWLVYGGLGLPALGPVGSAWATTACRLLMAVGLAAVAWDALGPLLRDVDPALLDRGPFLRLLGLGAPIGGQYTLEFATFGGVGLLMGWLGADSMAAHQVAINLASVTFMVPLGVSAAAAVLVGHAVGAGDAPGARRAAASALLCGAGFMGLMAALFLTLPGELSRLYTGVSGVLAIATALVPIAGLFQVFDGLQVVSVGVLRGVGDTRAPLAINVAGFWAVGMPVSLLLAFRLGLGPEGLWWGFVAGLGTVAALLVARVALTLRGPLQRVRLD